MYYHHDYRTFWAPPRNPQAGRKMTEGYHRTYKHDPRISMILKSSSNNLNMIEKHRYNTLIKFWAESLYRNYGKTTRQAHKQCQNFMDLISKNLSISPDSPATHLDSRAFLLLLKHIKQLKEEVLNNEKHEISPQSFLVFLDKLSNLTKSEELNEFLMRKLSSVNIKLLKSEKMLNAYHKSSLDYRFEENLRIEEIKKFASGVSFLSLLYYRLYLKQDSFLITIKSPILMKHAHYRKIMIRKMKLEK